MKLLLAICFLSAAFAQPASVPEKWLGNWALDVKQSTFGEVWGPFAAGGLTVTGQKLKITFSAGHLKIDDDTVTAERGSIHGENDLDLSRPDVVLPIGPRISFKRIDDSTFDIVVSLNHAALGNHVGENRFVFSSDGKRLVETKTHIEREVATEGTDPATTRTIKSSTTVLVFNRV